ncbi:helix-turn-helix domain-containing protein [Halorhodospira sp. 9622]|uniref:helix-turn-helix domain-containing protein n=1 Tax=Halorhodospira sp. 9622 TaxID=2899136 RepID=UPI001EE7C58D|nr:helix-turn-helix transcriptional regulator [Halorhodospira sp. 9622]MCG5539472.1 helix-turn-helix transcriptional regulator [Halorhodospira sp. 9622]
MSETSRKVFEIDLEVLALVAGLRAARAFLGLSQKDVSNGSGISVPTLNRLERLETSPQHRTVVRLKNYFNNIGIELVLNKNEGFYIKINLAALEQLKERYEKGEPITARGGIFKGK